MKSLITHNEVNERDLYTAKRGIWKVSIFRTSHKPSECPVQGRAKFCCVNTENYRHWTLFSDHKFLTKFDDLRCNKRMRPHDLHPRDLTNFLFEDENERPKEVWGRAFSCSTTAWSFTTQNTTKQLNCCVVCKSAHLIHLQQVSLQTPF